MAKKSPKKVEKVVEDVTALPIPKLGKELGRFEGETFYIAEHENGVLYHVYNSMDLIIRPNITSGYETLVDLVRNQELYYKLTGEEKESFELNISAISFVLSLPTFVFSSGELTFDIATMIIKFLQKSFDDAMKQPLQDEEFEKDREFQDAVIGLEDVKSALKEESNE